MMVVNPPAMTCVLVDEEMEKDPHFRSLKSKKSLKRCRISPCPSGKRFRGSDKLCKPIVNSGFSRRSSGHSRSPFTLIVAFLTHLHSSSR